MPHFSPELLPWVSWCYDSHPLLWHPLGQISSESGVQQGDPLGPLLFALVLQKLISNVEADEECVDLLYQAWYLDDGALAGNRPAVLRAVHIIERWDLLWACISVLPNVSSSAAKAAPLSLQL